MPASRSQVRITACVALALFLVFAATLFFRTQRLPIGQPFVPVTSIVLVMADWITATLLSAQGRVLQARPLRLLGAGYFLAGLLVVMRILTLPGLLAPIDWGAGYNLPLWFYLASHAALPLAIMIYAWPGSIESGPPASPRRLTRAGLIAAVILALGLTVGASFGEPALPWTSPIFLAACPVLLLIIAAMIFLGRRLASVLDLWLLLMLWGWFLETVVIALLSPSFTAGWYAARLLGLLSGLFVLFALLAETSKLYAQTVLQLAAQTQERENRFLIRDAITASIAHELRQPLSAILINAHVARQTAIGRIGEGAAPLEELPQVLDEIVASSCRANDIIQSTRAIFGQGASEKHSADVGMVLQNTLALVAGSARAQDVAVKLVVEGQPGPIIADRLQLQQALLNLFQNAIEALSHSRVPGRTLLVSSAPWLDLGVTIRVEDNGPGITAADRERIFDPFFTTRPKGTGMGLSIARSVIEAHGGRLDVEPRMPAGTVFVIHLPYDGQRPAMAAQ
jgi:signal transduction histidine kinase